MKKFIVGLFLLAAVVAMLSLAACGGNKVPAGAVAAVGNGTVTQAQFDAIIQQAKTQYASQPQAPPFPKEGTAQYNQLKASIMTYLVTNELVKQGAADKGVTVKQSDIDARMKQILTQVGGQKKLDALLKKQGVTQAQLTEQLKAQMLQDALKKKITDSATVTDAQVQAFFNDPKNKAQFQQPATVDARHVLVKTKAQAMKVEKLLKADPSDANWAKVAKKYSTDKVSAVKGGQLGSFPQGRMVAPFDKVAFSIKPNTISAPVKTQFGWHVIEVTKKTPAQAQTFDQAKATIKQQLLYTVQAKAWEDWLKTQTKDADVVYAPGFNPATLTASPSPAASLPAGHPSASPTK